MIIESEQDIIRLVQEDDWMMEILRHAKSIHLPYSSSIDAISKFPETATALGLALDDQNRVVLAAPCGIEDVTTLRIKPTPFFAATEARVKAYENRVVKKNWSSIWSKVTVHPVQRL